MTGLQNLSANLYSSANSVGEKVIRFTFGTTAYEVSNTIGTIVWLNLVRINHVLTAYYSANGFDWTNVALSIDVKSMDIQQADFNAWTGNRQGLYVKGSPADFDLYIYRDAYTSVLAECPANQYGTTRSTPVSGVSFLDQIHANDWAMYAGIEFGGVGNGYPIHVSSFEATASSVITSGVIEVWLDSIQTGLKIAECKISSTGSLSTYQTFQVEVLEIIGYHDVYLIFKGDGNGKLFQLKSFRFIGGLMQTTANPKNLNNPQQLKVFPNPAKNRFTITCEESFSGIRILNLNGQVAEEQKFGNAVKTITCEIHRTAGNYLLEVHTKKGVLCTKLTIQ